VNLDLEHALSDGEDYELLFTVPAERQSDFAGAWAALTDLACTPIGRMTGEPADIKLILADGRHMQLGAGGFDHLRSR
jgi:thiamine monophosphate kinase